MRKFYYSHLNPLLWKLRNWTLQDYYLAARLAFRFGRCQMCDGRGYLERGIIQPDDMNIALCPNCGRGGCL